MIKIEKLDESDPAVLYHHYSGQTEPQGANFDGWE